MDKRDAGLSEKIRSENQQIRTICEFRSWTHADDCGTEKVT